MVDPDWQRPGPGASGRPSHEVEFASLDRAKTVVIVPGRILEEHGPYLPSASDTYQARWLADSLARRVAARNGWTALVLPMIPLGHSGANDIARQWVYPGSVTIRTATLRAIYMDLADSLARHRTARAPVSGAPAGLA